VKQENIIDEIIKDVKSLLFDIKAEAVVIELEKKGLLRGNIQIENESTFKRPYRRDIVNYKKHHTLNKLFLKLSRNGVYDALPEGFFHKEGTQKGISHNLKRKRRKEEEKNTRLFFNPIENELFNQAVNIEIKERELVDNFYNNENEFLLNFWDLRDYINNRYVIKLLKILPHSHKIAGDLNLVRLYLEEILEQKVTFFKYFKKFELKNKKKQQKILGVNLTAGAIETNVAIPFIDFKIGPVDDEKLRFFYKDKEIKEFLEIFYSYFLPLELTVNTFFFGEDKKEFILNEKEMPIIGVSTKI